MKTAEPGEGTGEARSPSAYEVDFPRGSAGLLVAAWLLLLEGGVGLLLLPLIVLTVDVSIPPGDVLLFVGICVAALVGGALLYSRWRVSWWIALAASVGGTALLAADKGLTSWTEVYVAAAFTFVVVVLLFIGRPAAGKPDALAIASSNIPFNVKLTGVWLGIFAVIIVFFSLAEFDVQWMRENARFIFGGLRYTLTLAVLAILLAIVLALLGALGRLSKNPVAFGVAGFYTSFFRGTPLIVQLFLIALGLPQLAQNFGNPRLTELLTFSLFFSGLLGLGLNYGAYMTEIFRAGIQSVGHAQAEAADALGMTYAQKLRRVVLPQAARVVIPPTGNEFIAMMKDTALVSFLGIQIQQAEIFRRAQLIGSQEVRPFEAFVVAAALYWGLTTIFSYFQGRLERRLSRGFVRAGGGAPARAVKPRFLSGGRGDLAGAGGVAPAEGPEEPPPIPEGHGHGGVP